MLADRVRCAVPTPGTVAVGSTITLGAAASGFRSFLAAFGGGASCFFVLADGAGRALTGVWTVNAGSPETATITEILGNDRLGGTAGETFSGACIAYCALPAAEALWRRRRPSPRRQPDGVIGTAALAGTSGPHAITIPAGVTSLRVDLTGVQMSAGAAQTMALQVHAADAWVTSGYARRVLDIGGGSASVSSTTTDGSMILGPVGDTASGLFAAAVALDLTAARASGRSEVNAESAGPSLTWAAAVHSVAVSAVPTQLRLAAVGRNWTAGRLVVRAARGSPDDPSTPDWRECHE